MKNMEWARALKINDIRLYRFFRKHSFKIGIISIVVFFMTIATVLLTFDPNQYKEKLQQMVLESTGHHLILEGPLVIQYFPSLTIYANQVGLKKTENGQALVYVKTVKLSPSLFSLMFNKKRFSVELTELQYKSYLVPSLKTNVIMHESGIELFDNIVNLTHDIHSEENKEIQENQNQEKHLAQDSLNKVFKLDTLKIDTQTDIPKYYIKHKGENFQLGLLLRLFKSKAVLHGNTKLNVELWAEGNEFRQIKKTLKGQLEIEIHNGKMVGLNLIHSLKEAKSVLKTVASGITKTVSSTVDTIIASKHEEPDEATPFDHLLMKASINNGLLHTHELLIQHPRYHVQGTGYVHLAEEVVDYELKAFYHKSHDSNKAPLKIQVKGPIASPKVKAHFKSYMKYIKT